MRRVYHKEMQITSDQPQRAGLDDQRVTLHYFFENRFFEIFNPFSAISRHWLVLNLKTK